MKKISKIPTLIGIIFLIFGIAAGIYFINSQQIFRLKASPEAAPKDVRISNITDSSFTVSWVSDKSTTGFIKWGNSQGSLDSTELDEMETESITHTTTVRGLQPQGGYYFDIYSDGSRFDNGGIPWQVNLTPSLASSGKSELISGRILDSVGNAVKNALVFVTLDGGSPLSTTTSPTGGWVISITSALTNDLSSYVEIDDDQTLIEISVNAGLQGVSSAQIYPVSAKPVPDITLGEVYDFKNSQPSQEGNLPQSNINIPQGQKPTSRFNLDEQITPQETKNVTLESIDEGEIINTTDPEFFGKGPSGENISIIVESESPLSGDVTVSSSGSWKWSPPESLSPGTHTVTLKWVDTSGITRMITRSFIVSAAEGPSFESTPSASLTPTPTPTKTSSPTASATPTASASPTITPTLSPTPTSTYTSSPTSVALPDSGYLTPTLGLFIMGITVIGLSAILFKKA